MKGIEVERYIELVSARSIGTTIGSVDDAINVGALGLSANAAFDCLSVI